MTEPMSQESSETVSPDAATTCVTNIRPGALVRHTDFFTSTEKESMLVNWHVRNNRVRAVVLDDSTLVTVLPEDIVSYRNIRSYGPSLSLAD